MVTKVARRLCFGSINRATVRMDRVLEAGLPDKPFCTQMTEALAGSLNDCNPRYSGVDQSFALILDRGKSGLIL